MVKLDKKAIKTEPENPKAKLSALIVKTNILILGPALFNNKKNKFVAANKILLIISGLAIPKRATEIQPIKAPMMVIAKPKTLVTVAISLKLKPISI